MSASNSAVIYQFEMNLLVNKSTNLLTDQQISKMFHCSAKCARGKNIWMKNLSSAFQTVDSESITEALS